MAINEPTERAQAQTGKVTARQMLAAIRQGDMFSGCYFHGHATHDRPSYSDSFIFTLSSVKKDRKSKAETVTKIDVPGWVSNGSTSETKEHTPPADGSLLRGKWWTQPTAYRPTSGFWSVAREHLRDLLEVLPGDALVAFHVSLDSGTNEYLIRAKSDMNHEAYTGLHCDRLYLVAEITKRGKTVQRTFMVETSTCPHNSARFGSPRHERDETGRGNG
jgi:hypothetical protein